MSQNLPALSASPDAEIARLAARARRAGGPLMALLNRIGGGIEHRMAMLPEGVQRQIEAATLHGLERAFAAARLGRHAPDLGRAAAPLLAAMTGAAGGAGGLVTAVAELPVTITLILHAIRSEAAAQGFDPDAPGVRGEVLRVFASGSPMAADDGVNTAFLGARLALSGTAVQKLIATLAPKVAAALGQKLAAQAVPVLGAVSGAAINAAFLSYYRELAHIRFALLRLAEQHGAEVVATKFAAATRARPILRA